MPEAFQYSKQVLPGLPARSASLQQQAEALDPDISIRSLLLVHIRPQESVLLDSCNLWSLLQHHNLGLQYVFALSGYP